MKVNDELLRMIVIAGLGILAGLNLAVMSRLAVTPSQIMERLNEMDAKLSNLCIQKEQ